MATMYIRRSRLTPRRQGRLIGHFVAGSTARAAAGIVGVQANMSIRFFMRLHRLVAGGLPSCRLGGEAEAGESRFGGVRKGGRGRGAAGKVAVFGLLKRGGKVWKGLQGDHSKRRDQTLPLIIHGKAEPDGIVCTDTFAACNAPDISDFHHRRINHSRLFADRRNHINGIGNFRNRAKRHMRKYNGVKPDNFHRFLKECEWRVNAGNHADLLKQLKSG